MNIKQWPFPDSLLAMQIFQVKPSKKEWGTNRLAYKGPTNNFHEIKPDFAEYFNWLRYRLPAWEEKWGELGFAVLALKDAYWKRLKTSDRQIRAKL